MKNKLKHLTLWVAAILLAALMLSGCNSEPTEPTNEEISDNFFFVPMGIKPYSNEVWQVDGTMYNANPVTLYSIRAFTMYLYDADGVQFAEISSDAMQSPQGILADVMFPANSSM